MMMVILLNKKIQITSFNVIIFSLAVTDFMASIIGLPNYILSTSIFNHPVGRQGDWLCRMFTGYVWPFFFLDVSVFLLTYIALERRKSILDPLSIDPDKPIKPILVTILLLVFAAFLLGLPTIYGIVYDIENNMVGNFCKYRYSFVQSLFIYVAVFILDTIIPVVILVLSYHQITSSLKKTSILLKTSIEYDCQRSNLKKTSAILGSKCKTIQTLKMVNFAFFACIVPNHLLYLLSLAGVSGLHWNTVISQVGVLIRLSNSFVNPFIYSIYSTQFKKNFWSVYYKIRRGHSKYYEKIV